MIYISKTYPRVRHCRYLKTPVGTTWAPPREIADLEIILIVQGIFHYIDAQELVIANPGDIVIIEPDTEHIFSCKTGSPDGIHICAHFDLLDKEGQTCLINQLNGDLKRCVKLDDFNYVQMLFENTY